MKVLFAVSSESISDAIIKRYQKDYKEILSYKNVYYFNAILKEIQKDKTYDRIVISEDLEPFANNNYDAIDKFIFEKLDNISDEAQDIDGNETSIIMICTDRHTPGSSFLVKLFGIGIYNALLGSDRKIESICKLINKPRVKKEAKMYYKIDADDVNYNNKNEKEVSELEIQNILTHFKKLGRNTDKYAESFNNIAAQYTDDQLKIIVNCLPMAVKAVLEDECQKYQELMAAEGMIEKVNREAVKTTKEASKQTGIKIDIIENKLNQTKMTGPIVIPSSVRTSKNKGPAPVRPMGNNLEIPTSSGETTAVKKVVAKKEEPMEIPSVVPPKPAQPVVEETPVVEEKVEAPVENVAPVKEVAPAAPAPVATQEEQFVIKKVLKTMPDGSKKVVKVKVRVQPENAQAAKTAESVTAGEEKVEEKKLPFDPTVKEKGKRGRPRKNPEEEDTFLPQVPDDDDDFILPSREDGDGTLPGLDMFEEELPGLDFDANAVPGGPKAPVVEETPAVEESIEDDLELPGLDDFEEDTLPGLEETVEETPVVEEATEEDDLELPGLDDFEDDALPGLEETVEEVPAVEEVVEEIPAVEETIEESVEETIEEVPAVNDDFEEDALPGLDDFEDDTLPELDDFEDDGLPGLADDFEDDGLPALADDFEDDGLPGLDDFEETVEETPVVENTVETEEVVEETPVVEEVEEESLVEEVVEEVVEETSTDIAEDVFDEIEEIMPDVVEGFEEVANETTEEVVEEVIEEVEEFTDEVVIPGLDELDEDILPVGDDFEDVEDVLPMGDDNADDGLLGDLDDDFVQPTSNAQPVQPTNEIESIKPKVDYSMSSLNSLLTKDKKIVTFLGTTKNGTSFLINNLAALFSSVGINTAILDMTKNRNSYYIYTNNEEELRNVAYNSISKLQKGFAEGIKVNKNLSVYTALPNDGKDYSDAEPILSTLVQNHSLILIDCDFDTDPSYFASCQEIYLVQSMDILTIQPLTAFLRDLKAKGVLESEKVRVVINKELKVRSLTTKAIIGGMSFYNDPSMSFMTELFNKDMVKACSIPFEEAAYSKYLDAMVNCNVSISGYSKQFLNKLRNLGDMVYPLVSKPSGKGAAPQVDYSKNAFSSNMSNTLTQMKKKF